MGDVFGGPARPFLTGIMVLALLVLVAACANLAGIFAARTADRARELAIRLSIGSTRWRILRQLLTEAVLVSLAAGVAGTFVAAALLGALSRWQPIAEFPIHVTVVAGCARVLDRPAALAGQRHAARPAPGAANLADPRHAGHEERRPCSGLYRAASRCAICCSACRSPSAPCW